MAAGAPALSAAAGLTIARAARAVGLARTTLMRAWHAQSERRDPAGHARFLRTLGIGRAEIGRIRKWSVAPTRHSATE